MGLKDPSIIIISLLSLATLYQLMVSIIEQDLNIDLFDDVEVPYGDIKFKKNDSDLSIIFIVSVNSYHDSRESIFQYYLGEIRKDIKKAESLKKLGILEKKIYWWSFEADYNYFIPYSKSMNTITERAYQDFLQKKKMNLPTSPLIYSEISGCYHIEFDPKNANFGAQKNTKTGMIRKIRRTCQEGTLPNSKIDLTKKELKFKPLKEVITDYPKHWTDIENLSYKTSIFNMVSIDLKSEEAKNVIQRINNSRLRDLKVYQIDRVQNLVAYHKYIKEKNMLEQKYDEGAKLEMNLFHGTRT